MTEMNCLNLTLSQRPNVLDGITLYEPVDISVLDKLINSSLLKTTFNNPFCKKKYTNEYTQLTHYRSLIDRGRAVVNYNRYENNPFGRSNPDNAIGLFSIRREIRHTLASERFEDVDIEGAHPNFLEQILKYNVIECPCLQEYVNNRQSYFDLVIETFKLKSLPAVQDNPKLLKELPKNLFIRILFGGGIYKWIDTNFIPKPEEQSDLKKPVEEFSVVIARVNNWLSNSNIKIPAKINDFIREVKRITKKIADANPELSEIVKANKAKNGKTEYNLNGSICSFFLQEKEIIILEQIFIYCKEKGYIGETNNSVLCADGIMIEKHLYKPELLKQLNVLVKLKTGFNLTFTNKAMDEDYLKILDKNLTFDLYTPTYSTGLIADYFRIMYSNKFMVNNGKLYVYNGVYWREEIDKQNSTIHNFIDTTFYKHMVGYISEYISKKSAEIGAVPNDANPANKIKLGMLQKQLDKLNEFLSHIQTLRTHKNRVSLISDVLNKITCDHIKLNVNPYLLAFTNKIYDLQTGVFVKPKYTQYISMTTGWDWCDYYQKSEVDELDRIIDTIFPIKDVKEYYLTALSTGLFGQQIEKIFIANGVGGNGKSLINSLMLLACGDYGYKLPSNVLLNEIKSGANPEVATMNMKRFVLTQEPDGKKRICSATLKEITGDPTLNCRILYSNDTKTTLVLSLFLECNNLPKLDEVGVGVERRGDIIPFIGRFVDKNKYDQFTEQERKDMNIALGNPHYKTEEFKQRYKQALITLLLGRFKTFAANGFNMPSLPKICKEKARDWLSTSDDIYSWFLEYYEKEPVDIDENDKSFIYIDELYEIFTSSEYYTNMTKSDKRASNLKSFTKNINENLFLQLYIKQRGTRYGYNADKNEKFKHNKAYITTFRKIVKNENEDGDSDEEGDQTDNETTSN